MRRHYCQRICTVKAWNGRVSCSPFAHGIHNYAVNVLALASLTIILGCSTNNSTPQAAKTTTEASDTWQGDQQPTSSDAAQSGLRKSHVPGTEVEVPTDNPLDDGWISEAISQRINHQLRRVTRYIETRKANVDELAQLTLPSFHCMSLRPINLETTYHDGIFRVSRLNADQPSSASSPHFTGPSGLANALSELISLFDTSQHLRTSSKLYRVTTSGEVVDAHVHLQLYGSIPTGRRQIEAVWICSWREDSSETEPQLASISLDEYQVADSVRRQPIFVDRTEHVLESTDAYNRQLRHGVDYWLGQIESRTGIDIGGWQGLAVGDVNDDGWDDVYVCQPGGLPNRLLVQGTEGRVRDESHASRLDILDATHAALIVDLDNDGDQDIAVAVMEGLLLLANDGQGQFELKRTLAFPAAIPYSLSAVDDDQDGDLDLFACCYNRREGAGNHIVFARPVPYHDANNGGRNVMLRNEGSWRFRHVTRKIGLDENNRRFSYASAWEDYDNDGDQDLYVANDFGRNNLYRNHQGRFVDVASESRVQDIGPGMSACWGDLNNDGWMDLYVSNMFSSAGNRIAFQQRFLESSDLETRRQFQRHARGNSLFQNNQGQVFSDISTDAGVTLGRWAWGSNFVDLNNDGWEDILVTNGFITQEDTGDL